MKVVWVEDRLWNLRDMMTWWERTNVGKDGDLMISSTTSKRMVLFCGNDGNVITTWWECYIIDIDNIYGNISLQIEYTLIKSIKWLQGSVARTRRLGHPHEKKHICEDRYCQWIDKIWIDNMYICIQIHIQDKSYTFIQCQGWNINSMAKWFIIDYPDMASQCWTWMGWVPILAKCSLITCSKSFSVRGKWF